MSGTYCQILSGHWHEFLYFGLVLIFVVLIYDEFSCILSSKKVAENPLLMEKNKMEDKLYFIGQKKFTRNNLIPTGLLLHKAKV